MGIDYKIVYGFRVDKTNEDEDEDFICKNQVYIDENCEEDIGVLSDWDGHRVDYTVEIISDGTLIDDEFIEKLKNPVTDEIKNKLIKLAKEFGKTEDDLHLMFYICY